MQNKSLIEDPTAIEELVCRPLESSSMVGLEVDEFQLLAILLTLKKDTLVKYVPPREFEVKSIIFSNPIEAKLFSEHLLSKGGTMRNRLDELGLKENIMEDFTKQEIMKFLLEAGKGRADILGLDIDLLSLIFLASISKVIGNMVVYLTYCRYRQKKLKLGRIDIEMLGRYIIPNGKFSDEIMKKVWDNQKVSVERGPDNLIDYRTALQSIL